VTKSDDTKADRKVSAAAVDDEGAYEDTAFGRRRVSRWPKALRALVWLVGVPFVFVYRRLRGSRGE
jgi:hypothetical protein